jgi:16S rRNA G966 N2-methylase RsmD
MATVTYKNQPAIERTKGRVPLAGTFHLYRVNQLLWPNAVESFLERLLISRSLHLCCGHSSIGDVRADIDASVSPHVFCDAAKLPFANGSFDSVLCDPPYNGNFQRNHDVLSELSQISKEAHHFSAMVLACRSARQVEKVAQISFG